MPSPQLPAAAPIRRALLAFWDARRRDLPWRRDRDPYRIWVSEVMLQQTRVETVLPYFERWMTRFPSLAALAAAPLDDVLVIWQGLGYYSRARNLHRAARQVIAQHGGRVPTDAAALRRLPGIGEYTAGAIASIAFDRREPAVDGNTRRVLSRLLDDARPSPDRLRSAARALADSNRPGDVNQALMELGATVCTPRAPACDACPIRSHCIAAQRGTQLSRPAPPPRRDVPCFDVGSAIIIAPDRRFLLVRRPDRGLLAGLWEFPGAVTRKDESPRRAAIRAARNAGARIDARTARSLGAVPHAFTHRHETYHAFRIPHRGPVHSDDRARWVRLSALTDLPLPKAQLEIANLLR